ncbi:MAG: hypothetical protein ABI238_07515, partial [Terrimesophilobacter sp.]
SLANATVGLNPANGGGTIPPGDPGSDDPAAGPAAGGVGQLAFTGFAWTALAILIALALTVLGGSLVMRKRRAGAVGVGAANEELLG